MQDLDPDQGRHKKRTLAIRTMMASALTALTIIVGAGLTTTLGWPSDARAARGESPIVPFGRQGPAVDNRMVEAAQAALAKLGIYKGPVDGRPNNNLEAAIRLYERQAGLKITGQVSQPLLDHLERSVRVTRLLRDLDRSREKAIDAAREALLSHPATRDLLNDQTVAPADAARDASKCLDRPTVRCLLAEAYESAKAVAKRDLRDWAMGEILSAQARAGLMQLAMETTRRIQDPRLMMVALREIAAAQARAGREEDALAAAEIIPESRTQVQALSEIARTQARHGYLQAAQDTAALLFSMARHLRAPADRVTFATQAAVTLYQSGDPDNAEAAMDLAWATAEDRVRHNAKPTAWRQIAGALAKLDQPEAALGLTDQVTRPSDRAAVLIAAARASIRAGDLIKARELADQIEPARYRVLVLGEVAAATAKDGDIATADRIIDTAFADAESVTLPFARSYAISRLVLALSDMARVEGAALPVLTDRFARARQATTGIKDLRLRAQVLFEIAAWQRRSKVDQTEVSKTEKLAIDAAQAAPSAVSRVWVHGDIATMHARAGEADQAWRAFARGMAEARRIDNAWGRARSLAKMSQTLIDLVARATAQATEGLAPGSNDDP